MAVDALDIGGMRPITLPDNTQAPDPRLDPKLLDPSGTNGIPLVNPEGVNRFLNGLNQPTSEPPTPPIAEPNAEPVADSTPEVVHYSAQGPAKLTERGVNTDPNAARDTINRFKSNIFGPEGYQTVEPEQLPFEMVGQKEAAEAAAAAAAKIDAENKANKPEKSFTQTVGPVAEPEPIVEAAPAAEPATEAPTRRTRRRAFIRVPVVSTEEKVLVDQPEGPVIAKVQIDLPINQ